MSQREDVVRVARSYLGTPYHHAARVKGSGVDCLSLLACVYEEAGVVAHIDLPAYSHQWHLNRSAELYLNGLLEHAHEIDGPPLPGDVALFKFGRCFSHGAIVVEWPVIIHAWVNVGCTLENVVRARWLSDMGGKPRPKRFFTCW